MRNMPKQLLDYLAAHVGHCAICMRRSLLSAVAAWVAFAAVLLVWPGGALRAFAGGVAVALTILWMLHVIVRAARVTARTSGERAVVGVKPGRRRAIGAVLRAASIGVVASLPSLAWPSVALAFCGQCTRDADCGGRSNGWCCKNTAPVNSGRVCNECVRC